MNSIHQNNLPDNNPMKNQAITIKFLSLFNYKFITIYALPHPDVKKSIPPSDFFHPKSTDVPNSRSKISHAFRFFELQNPQTYALLTALQTDQKRTINFTLHETDGLPNSPTNPNMGDENRFTTLKTLCIDTDKTPIEQFDTYLKSIGLLPHIVVSSSPNRYHLYFLLKDTPINPESKAHYQAIQKALHQFSDPSLPPCDATMLDIPQQMKLPGFIHQTKNHLIQPIKYNSHAKYSLDEAFTKTKANLFLPPKVNSNNSTINSPTTFTPYTPPPVETAPLSAGNRHEEIKKFIGHTFAMLPVFNPNDPNEDLKRFNIIFSFIHTSIQNALIFLPPNYKQGKHHLTIDLETFPEDKVYAAHSRFESDTMRLYNYVKDLETKKSQESQKAKLISQLADVSLPSESHQHVVLGSEESKTTFTKLPSDFYLNAPGMAGKIIKELQEGSILFTPAYWFAETCAFLALIKAKCVISEKGFVPAEYFACFGGSGTGKKYAQNVLHNTAFELGLSNHVVGNARGNAGFAEFVAANDSIGLFCLDEASELFSSFRQKNTPAPVRALKNLLLQLYTSYSSKKFDYGATVEKTSNGRKKKESSIIFSEAHLTVSVYAVPDSLNDMFDVKSVEDGLFPRFIFLTNDEPYKKIMDKAPATSLSKDTVKLLENYKLKYRLKKEDVLRREELLSLIMNPELKPEEREAMLEEIETLEQRPSSPIILKYTEKAKELFNAYDLKCQALYQGTGQKGPLAPVYARLIEHVGRLSVILAEDVIDEDVTAFCIELMENRRLWIENIFKGNDEHIQVSDSGNKDMDAKRLKQWFKKYFKENKTPFVTFRDMQNKFTGNYSHKSVQQALYQLEQEDFIIQIKDPTKEHFEALKVSYGTKKPRLIIVLKDM